MVNSKEITDIKSITVSSKSCKFVEGGCVLEAKFGKITLSVPALTNIMVILRVKKISGNGKISVNGQLFVVQPKMDELQISVHDKMLEIERPSDATGEVAILGMAAYHDEGEALKKKWKSLIAKCGEYKSIRMVDDRLYASIGAVFENGSTIKHIETNPPGLFYRDGSSLKFNGPCEIVDIVVNESIFPVGSSTPEFIHRDAPGPTVAIPPPLTPNPLVTRPSIRNIITMPAKPSAPVKQEPSILLYDSVAAREFDIVRHGTMRNKTSKFLKSNGKDYLVLKRGGSYTFPVSFVKAHSEYTVVVTSKKLNGNGRLQIGFINNGTAKYPSDVFVVNDVEIDRLIKIKTTHMDGMPRFSISMPETSIGEILIKSVKIYGGNVNGIQEFETVSPFMYEGVSLSYDQIMEDIISIRNRNRDAAMLEVQSNGFPYEYPEVFGHIEATNFNSKIWLSRVLSVFPNVRPVKLGIGSYIDRHQPDIILTSLDTLKISNRIWLEEFCVSPNREQIELLKKTKSIFTPSLTNKIELQSLLPEKEIEICHLAYPYKPVRAENEKYILYFENDIKHTDLLIRSWRNDYPSLMIVGSNMRLLPNMKHVSEYEAYAKLFGLIAGASTMIELSSHNHFINGLSDICRTLSVPLVTNNHNYLMENRCKVIRPSVETIQASIEEALLMPRVGATQTDELSSKSNMLTLLGK